MLRRLFWNTYAFCYDGLNFLYPYKSLLREVVAKLHIVEGDAIADLGCGTGNAISLISNTYPKVIIEGIDNSPAMIARARMKLGSSVPIIKHNLDEPLPLAGDRYTKVLSMNVLYSLKDPIAFIKEAHRILKPGGTCVLVNPKKGATVVSHLVSHIKNDSLTKLILLLPVLLLIGIMNQVIVWMARENYYFFFDSEKLREICERSGFQISELNSVYADQAYLIKLRKPT